MVDKTPEFQPFLTYPAETKSWRRFFAKFILPLLLVWTSLITISDERSLKDDLKLETLMSDYAQDADNVPQLTINLPSGTQPFDCPGASCPLNITSPENKLGNMWLPAKSYIAERATTESWRATHYTRIETTLPKFAAIKGASVAFDIIGIEGESFRLFVNGIEKANGPGGHFHESIIFKSDGGIPGEPLVLGLEVKAGRNFAPGIIYISQPFLSAPEIAPVIRAAYRGKDKEVILPNAYARATIAILAALGCFFTPFFIEILFFAASVTTWNYLRLLTNDMAPFPAFLDVDFTTLYAALICLFNATTITFFTFYFRTKSRSLSILSLSFLLAAAACLAAGKFGAFIAIIPAIVNNEFVTRSLISLVGFALAFNTWRRTRHIETAHFRNRVALIFAIIFIVASCLEAALQLSIWGSSILGTPPAEDTRWLIRRLLEAKISSFGVAIALEWALVVRMRRAVLQRFGMIIDPRVLKEIIGSKKIPSIRAKRVVALFADLRGFTTLCDQESPQEVNLTLNEYLAIVSQAVHSHGGVIDKFVGDEVMAVWGVPQETDADSLNAARCAVDIRRRMRDLNRARQLSSRKPLACGIGIHCGPAIVGPVGTPERIDFTAIGPTINVAARLQSMTKEKKCDILISGELYDLIKEKALAMDLGDNPIRGMNRSVKIVRLLGVANKDGALEIHDTTLEASGLPQTPGIVTEAPDNLFKAS